VAVVGNGPGHGRDDSLTGGVRNASSADAWLVGAEGRLLAIDEYYRETGALREQLTPADVLARALESGGFTYNPLYGATPQQGYAVSLNGHGKVLDCTATADDLLEYLQENVDQVKDPARYVGGWIDGGRFYLDVSIVLQDGKEARSAGRLNDQAGIFDLGTGETVYLKGPDGQWLVDAGGNWLSIREPAATAASAA
jgi:hypothetical protein